ncbi:MAG: hypothetical protein PWP03_668 [Candidatus Woesearchaeota archaeon]|nr:hypothetical protein [Candidatus Woesearchaeota archaeon]MDN5328030.1 hypothetical protein [Candidatus Woesearchaeota archaeon]
MLSLNLDLKSVEEELRTANYKKVCLQFPDGLKPKSKDVVDSLRKKFPSITFFLWAGSNFGGCDIPIQVRDFDLIINFGHAEFKK